MTDTVAVKANFKSCNAKDNGVVMQFELFSSSLGKLPELVQLVGQTVYLDLEGEQQRLPMDEEEPLEGQEVIAETEEAEWMPVVPALPEGDGLEPPEEPWNERFYDEGDPLADDYGEEPDPEYDEDEGKEGQNAAD